MKRGDQIEILDQPAAAFAGNDFELFLPG